MTDYSTLVTAAIAQAYANKAEVIKGFVVGRTYFTTSVCDHNCVYTYKVVKRTAKTVTLQDDCGKITRRKVNSHRDGLETVYPEGVYSMCPVLSSDKLTA